LNLQYVPAGQASVPASLRVALVMPQYTGSQPGEMDIEKEPGPDDSIPRIYRDEYLPNIQASLLLNLKKILISKGFTVGKSYSSLEKITDQEKQSTDIIVITTFDFAPQVNNNQTITSFPTTGYRSAGNQGTLQFVGFLKMQFLDSRSGKVLVSKTIDVGSLSSEVEYEEKEEAEYQCLLMLNGLYPELMKRIDKSIDAKELITAQRN